MTEVANSAMDGDGSREGRCGSDVNGFRLNQVSVLLYRVGIR